MHAALIVYCFILRAKNVVIAQQRIRLAHEASQWLNEKLRSLSQPFCTLLGRRPALRFRCTLQDRLLGAGVKNLAGHNLCSAFF